MSTELQTRPDTFISVAQWVDDLLTEWERAEAEGELPETIAVIARELEKATARGQEAPEQDETLEMPPCEGISDEDVPF